MSLLQVGAGAATALFKRSIALPSKKVEHFQFPTGTGGAGAATATTTALPNTIALEFYEGERPRPIDNQFVCRYDIDVSPGAVKREMAPVARSDYTVEVTINLDTNGIVWIEKAELVYDRRTVKQALKITRQD